MGWRMLPTDRTRSRSDQKITTAPEQPTASDVNDDWATASRTEDQVASPPTWTIGVSSGVGSHPVGPETDQPTRPEPRASPRSENTLNRLMVSCTRPPLFAVAEMQVFSGRGLVPKRVTRPAGGYGRGVPRPRVVPQGFDAADVRHLSLEALAAALRQRGERLTRARLAVMESLIGGADRHLTAEDIIATVRTSHPELAESSIYRSLEWLQDTGVAEHVHLGHGAATWQLASGEAQHLVCEKCGAVAHVPSEVFADALARIERDFGFRVQLTHFATSGLCRACLR